MRQRKLLSSGYIKLDQPTPTNFVRFKVRAPMFVFSQFMETGVGLFTKLPTTYREFYTPSFFRDRQGNPLPNNICNELTTKFQNFNIWLYNFYRKLVDQVDPTQVDMLLPQSLFVEFYWAVNAPMLQSLNSIGKHELNMYIDAAKSILSEGTK